MKIGAIVIFYNPDESVYGNIYSFIFSVEKLLIFDNSDVKNEKLHKNLKVKYGEKIELAANDGNVGIGKALNYGVHWAIASKLKWLLTMDQDSSFNDDTFFNTLALYQDRRDIAVFSPTHKYPSITDITDELDVNEETIVMTSGNILNLELCKTIGAFSEKLFIDEVDHDYCLRAGRLGFKILRFTKIYLRHNLGSPLVVERKSGNYVASQHSSFRIYYITRNNLYIIKNYFLDFPLFTLGRILNMMALYKDIVFYQSKKLQKIRFGFLGLFHFLKGRYGKL